STCRLPSAPRSPARDGPCTAPGAASWRIRTLGGNGKKPSGSSTPCDEASPPGGGLEGATGPGTSRDREGNVRRGAKGSPMTNSICYLNGRYLDTEKARISPFDRGFLFGEGLFETWRTYRGRPYA